MSVVFIFEKYRLTLFSIYKCHFMLEILGWITILCRDYVTRGPIVFEVYFGNLDTFRMYDLQTNRAIFCVLFYACIRCRPCKFQKVV